MQTIKLNFVPQPFEDFVIEEDGATDYRRICSLFESDNKLCIHTCDFDGCDQMDFYVDYFEDFTNNRALFFGRVVPDCQTASFR